MKFIVLIVCGFCFACAGPESDEPNTDSSDPTSAEPDPSDASSTDAPADPSDSTDTPEPEVPQLEPIDYEHPEIESPMEPNLPACLAGESPLGCAELPVAPTLPAWDCPAGWSAVDKGSVTPYSICEPNEDDMMPACPAGTWPEGAWANYCDDSGDTSQIAIYVDDDAPVDVNGMATGHGLCPSLPLTSIDVAIETAQYYQDTFGVEVQAILVAKGTYSNFINNAGVRVIGACADETVLINDQADAEYFMFATPLPTSLENVTVQGTESGIIVYGSDTRFENVVVDGDFFNVQAANTASALFPSKLTLENVVVKNLTNHNAVTALPDTEVVANRVRVENLDYPHQALHGETGEEITQFWGYAFSVAHGATLTAEYIYVENTLGAVLARFGLEGMPGGQVSLQYGNFEMVPSAIVGLEGSHILATDIYAGNSIVGVRGINAELNLSRGLIAQSLGAGFLCTAGSQLGLTDFVVDGATRGVSVLGSTLNLERVRIHNIDVNGLELGGWDSLGTLRDLEVSETRLQAASFSNTTVDAERLYFHDGQFRSLDILATGGSILDLTIENTEPLQDVDLEKIDIVYGPAFADLLAGYLGYFGQPVVVTAGSRVALTRVSILNGREVGIWAKDSGTRVQVNELFVSEVNESIQDVGVGIWVDTGARVNLEQGLIEQCSTDGVYIRDEESELTLTDVLIRDTGGSAVGSDEEFTGETVDIEEEAQENQALVEGKGRAMAIDHGAKLEASRVRAIRSQTAGIWVLGQGAHAEVEDLIIEGVSHGGFARTGAGAAVSGGALLEANRIRVAQCQVAGVWVQGEVEELESSAGGVSNVVNGEVATTAAHFENAQIREVERGAFTGLRGNGIHVTHGGFVSFSHGEVEACAGNGVVAITEGSSVELSDAIVIGEVEVNEQGEVESVEEAEEVENADEGGHGLAAIYGGSIQAEGVTVLRQRNAGILVSHQLSEIESSAKSSHGTAGEVELMSHIALNTVTLVQNRLALCINGASDFDPNAIDEFEIDEFEIDEFEMSELGLDNLSTIGIDEFESVSSQRNGQDLSTQAMAVTPGAHLETFRVERNLTQSNVSEVEEVE